MEFKDRLRALRTAAKLTQEQLAHACGWSGQSRISNYESGAREPAASELPALASALGVGIADLFSDRAPTPTHEFANRDERSALLRLDPSTLTYVRDVLDMHYKAKGKDYNFSADPEMLAIAYAFVADPKDAESLMAFTTALDARLTNQGEGEDGKVAGAVGSKRVRKLRPRRH